MTTLLYSGSIRMIQIRTTLATRAFSPLRQWWRITIMYPAHVVPWGCQGQVRGHARHELQSARHRQALHYLETLHLAFYISVVLRSGLTRAQSI